MLIKPVLNGLKASYAPGVARTITNDQSSREVKKKKRKERHIVEDEKAYEFDRIWTAPVRCVFTCSRK